MVVFLKQMLKTQKIHILSKTWKRIQLGPPQWRLSFFLGGVLHICKFHLQGNDKTSYGFKTLGYHTTLIVTIHLASTTVPLPTNEQRASETIFSETIFFAQFCPFVESEGMQDFLFTQLYPFAESESVEKLESRTPNWSVQVMYSILSVTGPTGTIFNRSKFIQEQYCASTRTSQRNLH